MDAVLEDRVASLLADWSEWQRLTDLFAPHAPLPARGAQVEEHVTSPEAEGEPVRWAVPGVWDDEPAPEPVVPSVGDLVAEAQRLVGLVDEVDPATLPPGQALGEARALADVAHRVRHALLARTRDVQVRHLYEHLGYRSAAAWQRDTAPDAVASDRALARRLHGASRVAEALRQGEVSFAAARQAVGCLVAVRPQLDRPDGRIDGQPGEEVVAAVLGNVVDTVCRERFGLEHDPRRDPEQAAFLARLESEVQQAVDGGGSQGERVEQALVLLARHVPVPRLRAVLEDLQYQLLPSALEDRERCAQDKRALALSASDDGTWRLEATLTPEVGEQLFAALAAEARRDPANPVDTAARAQARAAAAEAAGLDPWAAGTDVPEWEARALRDRGGRTFADDADELVPRTPSKRLHDAFGRLLARYLSHGLGGTRSKVPVQAVVTLSHRTVEGAPGAPPARGGSGRPLARSLVRRWWCDVHVTALLMSRGWRPLGVVHSGRTTTGAEMTALLAQHDNRCPGIGCCPGDPDPLVPLVPHHVRLFSRYGETSLEETLAVCPVLHDDLHLGKRTVRLRDGRLITEDGYLTAPD